MSKSKKVDPIREAYNKAAVKYGEIFYHELYSKPVDVKLLDLFCEWVNPELPVCEIGCGPGEISTYLKYKGISLTFWLKTIPGVSFSRFGGNCKIA